MPSDKTVCTEAVFAIEHARQLTIGEVVTVFGQERRITALYMDAGRRDVVTVRFDDAGE